MNSLSKNVLFTVAYFNAMDFYPTTFEIWRHYVDVKGERRQSSLSEIIRTLTELKKRSLVFSQNGFWGLQENDKDFYQERILKQKISIQKIKKAKKWNQFLCSIPFLRAVIFNGTLAMKNSNHDSDWDVLVIIKKDRIWLGRFFLSLSLSLVGKRRYGGEVANRFCLNHYLTESGLILEEQGIFIASEMSFSFWMIGKSTANRFYQINDFKNKSFLPNFSSDAIDSIKIKKIKNISKFALGVEILLEKARIAGFLNSLLKRAMTLKIEQNPKTKKPGADIRISDQALVFLPKPKRFSILSRTINSLKKD